MKLAREAGAKAKEETTRVIGIVTRDGKPVTGGRVGAWQKLRKERNRVNATVQRGRTVPAAGYEFGWAKVGPDGRFAIENLKGYPTFRSWYLVFEGPEDKTSVVGPIEFTAKDREVRADIPVVTDGAIEGRIDHVPTAMAGQVWVVAFDEGIFRREVLTRSDGTFRIEGLPPGRYGLKAGHDGYRDPHVPRADDLSKLDPSVWKNPAEPWQGAVVATVESGRTAGGVVLDLRPPGPIVDPPDRVK